jgi:hypothetical protein
MAKISPSITCSRNSLTTVKQILNNFANISGLECNFDKSCVMPTSENPDPEDINIINEIGFKFETKITLLGVEIKNTLSNVDEIFQKIKEKIIGLISYWERFRLTLPGRITVAKTFLVSQLNYIGSFLKQPSTEMLSQIQLIIDNFVKKSINIAHERITTTTNLGGLGMFNLTDFLASQRCMWISRAHRLPIDNWRYDLKRLAPGNNILLIKKSDIEKACHPILYDIVSDYCDFYDKFTKVNSNFKECFIFGNQSIKAAPDFARSISAQTFGRNFFENNENRIRSLTYANCFTDGRFKSAAEFAADGLPLSVAAWMTLRSTILHAKALLTKPDYAPHNLITSIERFISGAAKGSKRFRNIYSYEYREVDIENLRPVRTFANLVGLPVPEKNQIQKTLNSWTHSCYGNTIKEFIFKFRFNYLNLNNRINAYNPDVDPRCNFCRIRDPDTRIRDLLAHVFYDCPSIYVIVQNFIRKYFPRLDSDLKSKELYWYGIDNDTYICQSINLVIFDTLWYCVFRYKQKRTIPNYIQIERDTFFYLKTTLSARHTLRENLNNEPYTIISRALG